MILFFEILLNFFLAKQVLLNTFNMSLFNNQYHDHELYVCKMYKVNSNQTSFITSFKPFGDDNVHHMILYGCSDYNNNRINEEIWDCSYFDNICPHGEQKKIIYAWALNATEFHLPKDVGFMVGGESNINYLILQVHFLYKSKKIPQSHYGIEIDYVHKNIKKYAGVYLMAGVGIIPKGRIASIEIACKILEDIEIHPFAYRTHTHKLGQLVSGYKISKNSEWSVIAERNPISTPQAFYEVTNKDILRENDILAARCIMINKSEKTVYTGRSHEDEMCNFYLMYWTEKKFLNNTVCFLSDNDYFSKINLKNIPNY